MAHEEDRRWRERSWRDAAGRRDVDERRDAEHRSPQNYQRDGLPSSRFGENRGAGTERYSDRYSDQHTDRDRSRSWEATAGRNRNRGDYMSGSQGAVSEPGWNEGERWGERSGSNWEQTSWSDLERNGGRRGGPDRGGPDNESSRYGSRRDDDRRRQSGHDGRQDRDFGGSMRSGGDQGGRSYEGSSARGYGGASMHRGYGYAGSKDWGSGAPDDGRGFWDKATDEVSSWFGDEDAERRREMDRRHSGLGPRNYARSDSRINEDVCDRLTDHPMVDASDIEVAVSEREVTLSGTVRSRDERRRAEDIVEGVSGVAHVQNNLRVKQQGESGAKSTLDSLSGAASGAFGERGGSTMSSRSTSAATGSEASAAASPGDTPAKTTTGPSPGVMRADPSTSPTKGL